MVTLDVPCEARLLAVLFSFVVLLPVLEQTVMTRVVVRRNFPGVVFRSLFGVCPFTGVRNLRLARARLVSMLIRLAADCALLASTVLLVFSHNVLPRKVHDACGNDYAYHPPNMV